MVTSNELPAKQSRRPNTETWSCQAVEHWRTFHSSRPKWIIQTLLKFTSRTKITVQWWQNAEGNCSKWNSPAHSTCSFRSESARRLWMRYLCPSRQAMATFRVLNKLLPSRPRNGMSSIGEADEFVFFFLRQVAGPTEVQVRARAPKYGDHHRLLARPIGGRQVGESTLEEQVYSCSRV